MAPRRENHHSHECVAKLQGAGTYALGRSGVHADAIMDRIVHNTLWIETGEVNMREHTAATT